MASGLDAVRSALLEIADALAAYLSAAARPAETPAPAEDLGALLARAEDFYRTGLAFAHHDDPALSGLAAMLTSAYQVARASQEDVRTTARLVDSVLRPLADALPATPSAPQEPQEPPKNPSQLRSLHRLSGTWRSRPPPCGRASVPAPRPGCSRRSRPCRT